MLACVVAAALLTAGPATAASRGFDIRNASTLNLKLQSVQKVRKDCTLSFFECGPGTGNEFMDFEFEGRPDTGDRLPAGATHRFELKWAFGYSYAAEATYNIEGTNAQLQVLMITSTFLSYNSGCRILGVTVGRCTAGGRTITYTVVGDRPMGKRKAGRDFSAPRRHARA